MHAAIYIHTNLQCMNTDSALSLYIYIYTAMLKKSENSEHIYAYNEYVCMYIYRERDVCRCCIQTCSSSQDIGLVQARPRCSITDRNLEESRAILRVDMGFRVGLVLWTP